MHCTYSKTVSGKCPQYVFDSETCYYHTKVVSGLIETDERRVLMDSPTIILE